MANLRKSLEQLEYLYYEINMTVNRRWWRWLTCWFGGDLGVLISYRLDRSFHLIFGKSYPFFRIILFPFFIFLRILGSNHDISYLADIGKGLKILHPSLGIVISGYAIIGENLTLSGGNAIGVRLKKGSNKIIIGNNVQVGVNSIILGPVEIGDKACIGAGAVVINNVKARQIVGGVPAKLIRTR
jgi:serine acetyltransferase